MKNHNKNHYVIFGIILFFIFILNLNNNQKVEKEDIENKANVSEILINQEDNSEINEAEELITENNSSEKLYEVVSVIDGDTINVKIDEDIKTVRVIGINTPETVDPRKPVECFGKEASSKAKEILSSQKVYLKEDESQGLTDKYGRLLRYVFLSSGEDYGKFMISSGYAYEYTYKVSYKYQNEYKEAEILAKNNKAGLWSDEACEEKVEEKEITTSTQNFSQNGNGEFICSQNAYNCSDFSKQKDAQEVFDFCGGVSGDIHKLDQDGDGFVCESLP